MMTFLKQAMMTSISEVMETMFYLSFEFHESHTIETSQILEQPSVVICRLDYKGPLTGYFSVIIPGDLLKLLTADFMGQGVDDVKKDHMEGTIKEITNMIAGNTFSHLNNEISFHLGIPETIKPKSITNQQESEVSHFIQVETMDGILGVYITASKK